MAVDVVAEIEIGAPVDRVFRFAADPDNAPRWYVNIHTVNWKTEPPVAIGSQVEFVARFLGRELQYTYEFVGLETDRRVEMRASDPFPMETIYDFQSGGEGRTRMSLRNRGEPTGFSKVMSPLMSIMMRRAIRKDLLKLKELLELRELLHSGEE